MRIVKSVVNLIPFVLRAIIRKRDGHTIVLTVNMRKKFNAVVGENLTITSIYIFNNIKA